ncbi:MAG: antitoxin MazE-like protein [Paraburkholderia sp.]
MRGVGSRPIQIRVPETRRPGFADAYARQLASETR